MEGEKQKSPHRGVLHPQLAAVQQLQAVPRVHLPRQGDVLHLLARHLADVPHDGLARLEGMPFGAIEWVGG